MLTLGKVGSLGSFQKGRRPSLDLNFAIQKFLDSRITFTRGSNAMLYNDAGVLQYAPHQLLENANLSDLSGDTPSGYSAITSGSRSFVSQGSFNEVSMVADTDRPYLNNLCSAEKGAIHTGFMYITELTLTSGNPVIALFNGGSGGTSGLMQDFIFDGEGWYAIGFKMGPSAGTAQIQIGLGAAQDAVGTMTFNRPGYVRGLILGVAVAGSGVKLSGPPLGEWIGTDDADEPLYQPRFDHLPVSPFTSLGLLVEEARTNLLLHSEEIDDALHGEWIDVRSDVISNAAVAPDGNTTADALVEDSTEGATHYLHQLHTVDGSSQYTFSVFAKANTRTQCALNFAADGYPGAEPTRLTIFDLSAGTVFSTGSNVDDSGIQDIGGGWFRCWAVCTSDVNTSTPHLIQSATGDAISYNGDGSSSIYIWGAQLEIGAFPTSYIPTVLAAVARVAEVATMSDLSWFNSNEGTFLFEVIPGAGAAGVSPTDSVVFQIDDGGTSDRLNIVQNNSDGKYGINSTSSGGDNGNVTVDIVSVSEQLQKIAQGYALNDFNGAVDGTLATRDTTAHFPHGDVLTNFRLGKTSGAAYYNGHIGRATYWPIRKLDAELAGITA